MSEPLGKLPPGALAALKGRKAPTRSIRLTPASEIRSERVRWLWQSRIPLRGQTVVAGEKGLGKSTLANAWLPAKATRGDLDGELHG